MKITDATIKKSPRPSYEDGEREKKVVRLGTRGPVLLREHLKSVAANPLLHYRSASQLFSECLHRFLDERPWDAKLHGKNAFPWHGSRANSPDKSIEMPNVEIPLYLEPVSVNGKTVSGPALLALVKKTCAQEDVSGASFGLTFLWWVALVVYPPKDAEVRAALKALPKVERDERFTKFRGA